MSGILYYIIDTETTGLKANFHEMTEIGIIRCTDRVQLWRQIKCEYPERANFDALAITKKSMADLERGHERNNVVEECEKFFSEDGATPAHRCIVAHNAAFDKKFLHALWEQSGKQFPANLWLDTISLTKDFIKNADTSSLKIVKTPTGRVSTQLHACCDMVGVNKLSEAHNAKVDSRNTYLLYRNLVEEKKVNYLPFIKTDVHAYAAPTNTDGDDGGLDPSLLDFE
jgi:DNA polymerase III epsilon subunit-like protein